MDRISSRNLTIQIAFARTLAPALLLLSGLACSQATIGGGDLGMLTVDPGLSGPLKKDDQNTKNYKNNRVKFESYHPEVRGRFRPSGSNTEVEIKVKAEKTTHVRNWHQAMSNWEGYIVARIENVNRVNVPELGLTPSDQYAYIWIGELPSGDRGISFYTFENNGNLKEKGSLELDYFRFCRDYTGGTPRATFGKNHSDDPGICEPLPSISPTRANVAVQLTSYSPKPTRSVTPKPAGSAWTGGLWISCSGGCCDVGGGAFY